MYRCPVCRELIRPEDDQTFDDVGRLVHTDCEEY